MPSNSYKSPYASAFKSAMKRGMPCSEAVCNIAKKNSKTPNVVFNSLWKAGLCYRQKFNGSWIYWTCENGKGKSTNWKNCQMNMWQCFVDWCICSGTCTPEQMKKVCSSQSEFMKACRKWWNAQFKSATSKSTTKRRRPVTKSRKRTTTSTRKSTTARNSNSKRTASSSGKRTTARKSNARKSSSPRRRTTATARKSRTTSVRSNSRSTSRRGSTVSSRRRSVRRAA